MMAGSHGMERGPQSQAVRSGAAWKSSSSASWNSGMFLAANLTAWSVYSSPLGRVIHRICLACFHLWLPESGCCPSLSRFGVVMNLPRGAILPGRRMDRTALQWTQLAAEQSGAPVSSKACQYGSYGADMMRWLCSWSTQWMECPELSWVQSWTLQTLKITVGNSLQFDGSNNQKTNHQPENQDDRQIPQPDLRFATKTAKQKQRSKAQTATLTKRFALGHSDICHRERRLSHKNMHKLIVHL